jgi:hypothetical protein
MSSYHIAKDGKPTGPIDAEALRQQLASGALRTSDLCWCEGMAEWQPIGTVFSIASPAGAPLPLAVPPGAAAAAPHQLRAFPVAVAILLHYVTFGLFTFIWLNLMHGKICRVRADDPSAGRAIGFCFIPLFNLYWVFFACRRLCLRIDEQRDLYGLPAGNLRGLATAACIFQVIPYLNTLLGYTILAPVFLGMMQASVNELARTSATTAPRATLPVVTLPARGLSGGAIAAIICACIIPVTALLAAIAIPSFLRAREDSRRAACLNNLRLIDAAKEQVAEEHHYQAGAALSEQEVSQYLKSGLAGLVCRKGGQYAINPCGQEPVCSAHGGVSRQPPYRP